MVMAESPGSPAQSVFREFTDSRGLHWRIWRVTPSDSARGAVSTPPQGVASSPERAARIARDESRRAEWTQGWLLFETAGQRKRLIPIPEGWTVASAAALEVMCDSAKPVREPGS